MKTEGKEEDKMEETTEPVASRLSWVRTLPALVWLGLVPLLCFIYLAYVAMIQRNLQTQIRHYATQTAAAMQATMLNPNASPTVMPSPTP